MSVCGVMYCVLHMPKEHFYFLFSSLIAHAFASIFSLSCLLYSIQIDLFGNINNIKCLTQSCMLQEQNDTALKFLVEFEL